MIISLPGEALKKEELPKKVISNSEADQPFQPLRGVEKDLPAAG